MTELKSGMRLRSQVCTAEIIVVRPPSTAGELRCGGVEMVDLSAAPASPAPGQDGLMDGVQLGKRYTDEEAALEVLVTKAGNGTLTYAGKPLVLKEAKPLPASD